MNTAIRSEFSLIKAYSHLKIARNLQRQPLQLTKNTFQLLASAGCFRLCMIITLGEGCALSPRQNIATSVFYACACMHFTLRLITHILLCRCFAIFGNSGRVLIMALASAMVRAFLTLAEVPDMVVKVDTCSCLRCYLSGGQHPSEHTPLVTSSSLVLKSMTSSTHNLIGCHGALIGYQGNRSAT